MRKFRTRYWSVGPLATWLWKTSGHARPKSATLQGWDNWRNTAAQNHPYLYWFTDTLLPKLQNIVHFVPDVLNETRIYLRTRYVHPLHVLATGLKPGKYYEIDTRIEEALFQVIVDFVEIELANMQRISSPEGTYSVPWWRSYRAFNWSVWRCPQAGLDYLAWETTLVVPEEYQEEANVAAGKEVFTGQALKAQEVLAIYTWIVNVRRKRIDPYDAAIELPTAGLQKTVRRGRARNLSKRFDFTETHRLEKLYAEEDEDMLQRIVKIRHNLWT
jgi:hypothetical protein